MVQAATGASEGATRQALSPSRVPQTDTQAFAMSRSKNAKRMKPDAVPEAEDDLQITSHARRKIAGES